jgi:hypothetical protein
MAVIQKALAAVPVNASIVPTQLCIDGGVGLMNEDGLDPVFFAITDPAVIPEEMVPGFKNLIQALCKTDKQRAQAQAYLDARDMTLNQWLNNLPDEDEPAP